MTAMTQILSASSTASQETCCKLYSTYLFFEDRKVSYAVVVLVKSCVKFKIKMIMTLDIFRVISYNYLSY